MQPLEAGDPGAIGDYRLLRRLGAGGMGRVYLGRSPGGRTVAVKVVHPHFAADEEFRGRFRREIASARRVGAVPGQGGAPGQTWTAPVLDADPDAPVPWIATGYVAGPSLQQAVAEHGPLPERAVRALGAGLAAALGAVHALDLVHRDVKPSNVLLTLDGPRLIDFGIARATDGTAALTSSGVSVGSPGYMSPEQVVGSGSAGPASDVFSLGAVLAYAATGEPPFPGDSSAALLYRVVHEEAELDGLQGPLRDLISACLAKDAAARPTTDAVAERLAGEAGAAGLARAGWLPGPLVEQVSRRAVELLDLEPPEGGPDPDTGVGTDARAGVAPAARATPDGPVGADARREVPSGLVPFTHGAEHPVKGPQPEVLRTGGSAGTPSGPGPGAAGQRLDGTSAVPVSPAGQAAPVPGIPPRPSGAPVPAHHAPTAPGSAPQPGTGFGPPDPAYGAASRRAGGTASLTAGGRKVSCTLVLSVAGVLVAALLGTAFVLDLLPGYTAAPPTAGDEPSQDHNEPDGGADTVPDAFVGTWRGQLTMDNGLPAGTMTVTITDGEAGEEIATGDIVLPGLTCQASWTLTSATSERLATDASIPDGNPLCSSGGTEEEFLLREDGTLAYESHDDAGGNAAGTLTKAGG